MTMLAILALLTHSSHSPNLFNNELTTLRLSQLQSSQLSPIESPEYPDNDGTADDRFLPLFGHILDGNQAFAVDFVIDCQGRYFRQVHPDGGRRFNPRPNGRRHAGLDIRVRDGNFVCDGSSNLARVYYVGFADETARVKVAGFHPGYGWHVVLSRTVGGREIDTVFAHLRTILVRPDQVVEPGTVIGVVGQSGVATGPHLHYEERQDGRSTRLAHIASQRF